MALQATAGISGSAINAVRNAVSRTESKQLDTVKAEVYSAQGIKYEGLANLLVALFGTVILLGVGWLSATPALVAVGAIAAGLTVWGILTYATFKYLHKQFQ